jgi:hypothetical protein
MRLCARARACNGDNCKENACALRARPRPRANRARRIVSRSHSRDTPSLSLAPQAEERNRRRAAGLPVEFGVNYAAIRYMRERGGATSEEADALEAGALAAPAPAGSLLSSKAE